MRLARPDLKGGQDAQRQMLQVGKAAQRTGSPTGGKYKVDMLPNFIALGTVKLLRFKIQKIQTEQPLKPSLRGFLPNHLNLISAIQSWINEID